MSSDSPLWQCPECDRQFANRNQWHACTRMTIEEHLRDKTPRARELFRALEEVVRDCGPVRLHPVKTGIGFITRVTFAGATLRRRWLDVGFLLPYRLESDRIRKVETYGRRTHGHRIRIHDPDEMDSEFRGWIRQAYRLGAQAEMEQERPPSD